MLMMTAESMLSKRPILRFAVVYFSSLSYFRPIFIVFLSQGWATPGTRAELDTQARFCGTRAKPRKRVNGKAAAKVSLTIVCHPPFFL